MEWMSQVKTEHPSFTLESAASHPVPPASVFLCANMSSAVPGNHHSAEEGRSQA